MNKPTNTQAAENESLPIAKNPSEERFPVVGLGASAGGLEAFGEVLQHLDAKTGFAFVIVQHLDPKQESLLTQLLSKRTLMPVIEITDKLAIEANKIYVMPSHVVIGLQDGHFNTTLRRQGLANEHFPIDIFFRALAAERQELSVGVILSGSGSDGALGIESITQAGGLTFAQDENSASFDGMPSAARAIGVDYVLPAAAIGEQLNKLAQSWRNEHRISSEIQTLDESEDADAKLHQILALLAQARGTNFMQYKRPTVVRRIFRRMTLHKLQRFADYLAYIQGHPNELQSLYEDLLVKVTSFFRSAESFETLKHDVLLPLVQSHQPSEPIRVWVPGCATGEEAYSIAICLKEIFGELKIDGKVEIFATDLSEAALRTARQGFYDQSIAEHLSTEQLQQFFIKKGNGYLVSNALRKCCVFAQQNVIKDPPFSRVDLISCRNLLIYFAPQTQKRVLSTFHFALNPGGYLFLGSAETIGSSTELFKIVDKAANIFCRKISAEKRSADYSILANSVGTQTERMNIRPSFPIETQRQEFKSDAESAILRHMPPSVVVNSNFDILQFRGDTSPFLMQSTGEPTIELLKLCRPGLLSELRAVLEQAASTNEVIKKDAWCTTYGQQSLELTLEVLPFTDSSTRQKSYVVIFIQHNASNKSKTNVLVESNNEIKRLERELLETKDYLNAIIEREQATNEELKSASEEILSANEELQSTNEEMATAKEETQAANEELVTVNNELENRHDELKRLSDDLVNLFASVQLAIVMCSGSLEVRRFTRTAEKVFGLIPSDIGRTLAELSKKMRVPELPQLAAEVLESLNTKEQDIQDAQGHWYSLRIRPYRTADHKIDGIVLMLIDIDSRKKSFDQLKEAYDFSDAIIQTTPVPVLILDENLRVVTGNKAFYRHFQVDSTTTKGLRVYDLGNGQWNVAKLRELLENVLPKNNQIDNFIFEHDFPKIGHRTIRLSAQRLVQSKGNFEKILIAFNDISAEKIAELAASTAREAAESASKAKSEFLANMSHEIRTPLGAILGYSELLANPQQGSAEVQHANSRIRSNVKQLIELIDEILDIAKIEAGKLEVELIRLKLLPELAETYDLLQSRAEAKGLSFEWNFDGEIPEYIKTCPKRLRQILMNVGGNALKFTEHGQVRIIVGLDQASESSPSLLRFAVSDTGSGLSNEQQGRIFHPFSQADNSVTRRFGGTGLGLALARSLAEALGGDVALAASQLGIGSTFVITINPGPLDGISMLKGLTVADLEKSKPPSNDIFINNQRLHGLKILLAEDAPDNQLLISHFLRMSGAEVDVVSNGAEAVKKALALVYQLILMDIQMPILDGYEATRRLLATGYKTPIVALTAHALQGERERCLAAGCVDFISKPVKPSVLIDIVERIAKSAFEK